MIKDGSLVNLDRRLGIRACSDSTRYLRTMSIKTEEDGPAQTAASACWRDGSQQLGICFQLLLPWPRSGDHLQKISLDELIPQRLTQARRTLLHCDTSSLQCADLAVRTSLSTAHNRTSVTHSPSRGGRDTCDK